MKLLEVFGLVEKFSQFLKCTISFDLVICPNEKVTLQDFKNEGEFYSLFHIVDVILELLLSTTFNDVNR